MISLVDKQYFSYFCSSGFSTIMSVTELGVDGFGNIYFAAEDSNMRALIGIIRFRFVFV